MKSIPFLLLSSLLAVSTAMGAITDQVWSFQTGAGVVGSPAIDADGHLYVGSRDGKIYSLTAGGQKRWEFAEATDWIDASPVVSAQGTVYAGSWDHSLYALEATTGALKWRFETGSSILAPVALGSDGSVYVGSYDGFLYALTEAGDLRWAVNLGAEIEASVTIDADGHLYVGTVAGLFYSFTAAGEQRWSLDLAAGSTATAQGVYRAAALGPDGTIYAASRNGRLFAITPEGAVWWSFAAADGIDATPVVDTEGNVIFAARDGYLYKVDPDGIAEWELLVGDVFYASPVLGADGRIFQTAYAGSSLSAVLAVSPEGVVEAQKLLPLFNDASLTLTAGGDLLVGMFDGGVYALAAGTGLSTTAAWPKFAFNEGQTGSLPLEVEVDRTAEILAAFVGATAYADDWYVVEWLGWFEARHYPWIVHLEHGWWWVGAASWPNYWFYDLELGWLYAPGGAPNLFYRSTTASWVLFLPGTSVFSGGRWFYDYGTADYFSVVPGE